MASPQVEDGHTRIANDLLDAIVRFPFTGAQLRLVLWVARASYGWQSTWTKPRSMAQISLEAGVPKASVGWCVTALVHAGVLRKDAAGQYALNKNFEEWLSLDGGMLPLRGQAGQKHAAWKKESGVKRIGRFLPPTAEEVRAYCAERGRGVDPDRWYNYHLARNWFLGRTPMRDWKAGVRAWEGPVVESGAATGAMRPRCGRCRMVGNWAAGKSRNGKTALCESCLTDEKVEMEERGR